MLSSSYYYNQHTLHWSKAKEYEKWIDYLTPLKSKLSSDFDHDVRKINDKIEDLQDDLRKGVREDSVFSAHVNDLDDKKEENTENDSKLSSVISSLANEIYVLERKKAEEESLANEAYQNYMMALDEERRAAEAAQAKAISVLNVN